MLCHLLTCSGCVRRFTPVPIYPLRIHWTLEHLHELLVGNNSTVEEINIKTSKD